MRGVYLGDTRLLINDSAESEEGIKLLEKAGIRFQRIPANGPSMPVLLIGSTKYVGLWAIRLYLRLLKAHKETENAKSI